MPSFAECFRMLADELSGAGRLAALYVRHGEDLVAIPTSSSQPRRLEGASALVRTLSGHPATLVASAPEGDPFSQALLQELGAEAAVLIRDREELVAVACLEDLKGPRLQLDEQNAVRISALCAAGLRSLPPIPLSEAHRPRSFRALVGAFFPHFR